MAINLKQISSSDSDNTKLDKVNYNFDQLIANGGGPMGHQGIRGAQGPQGVTGPQGAQGALGAKGDQGAAGVTNNQLWTSIPGAIGSLTADTIIPVHSATTSTVYPPVVSVGFLDSDPEYNTAQSITGGNVPYQWLINRKSNFSSNLRFTNDLLTSYFDFTMTTVGGTNAVMKMGFEATTTGTIEWHAETHLFVDNISRNTVLEINPNEIIYNFPIEFRNDVQILDTLTIGHSSAAPNKLAVAVNNAGEIQFKTAAEIGGGVPYGTIISVLPSVFKDNNFFVNYEQIDASSTNPAQQTKPLEIRVGSGINEWAGWYLCHGHGWTDGTNSHSVPDLNSFDYSITDNASITSTIIGSSQGLVGPVQNNEVHIMGGTEATMVATQIPSATPGIYDVQGGITPTFNHFNASTGAQGPVFYIKPLPQIIYLADPSLYWSEPGIPS
ncbi:collagen-like protein [bacterium]|nr:collagen-like protein [bacterium]